MHDQPVLKEVARHFQLEGELTGVSPYGQGHINDTYRIELQTGGRTVPFILQRVNHQVFKDVPRLMENLVRVTTHLRRKLAGQPGHDPARETLTIIPTRRGESYYRDEEGNFWRVYLFIGQATTVEVAGTPGQAYEAARAFGRFQRLLGDLPGPRLHETIPGFHHTPRRFAALEQAVERDPHRRRNFASAEIDFAMERKNLAGVLVQELEAGRLPERVTHNDTKINNVMLDDATGRGVAVIDLDTVMPGLVHYDFGDQMRTTTCTGAEDERKLSAVVFRPDLFEALLRGYLDEMHDFLTPREIEFLPFSGRLITFEIGIRFLTDYLEGDTYFKTHRPGHNLDRARVQFARLRAMEAARADMEHQLAGILQTYVNER